MAKKKSAAKAAPKENKVSYNELVEKAGSEYGISNASEMSEKQLRAEVKAIDDQPSSADKE